MLLSFLFLLVHNTLSSSTNIYSARRESMYVEYTFFTAPHISLTEKLSMYAMDGVHYKIVILSLSISRGRLAQFQLRYKKIMQYLAKTLCYTFVFCRSILSALIGTQSFT